MAFVLAIAAPAFAYNEGGTTDPTRGSCLTADGSSKVCHVTPDILHRAFSSGTDKCSTCHTVHNAPAAGIKLMPRATISEVCEVCHDGSGGQGVYGVLVQRGVTPAAQHRIDVTNVIPGGDDVTGGDRTQAFGGPGGTLTCTDCHSPHDNNTVAAFKGDRLRTTAYVPVTSDRLLRRRPTGATTATLEYGSDWCMACHRGRHPVGSIFSHPVESVQVRADAYVYERVAALARTAAVDPPPTSTVTVGKLGSNHSAYLMPVPRVGSQVGHTPICQQCHEDSRDVGKLDATGTIGDATAFDPALDGVPAAGNPRFQNFPHETANRRLLVEVEDDLCSNCHKL
ncbi:MAG TPA: cytochrome c3 family protein [Coriobacteriia bacterium]